MAAALPLVERAERPWTSAVARHWAGRVLGPLAARPPFLGGSNDGPAAPLVQPWAMAGSAHSRPVMLVGRPSPLPRAVRHLMRCSLRHLADPSTRA
jgi:hypothetical protein